MISKPATRTRKSKLSATLARLLQAMPQPDLSVSSGDLELNARVTPKTKDPDARRRPDAHPFQRAERRE